ncbi:short-chain dehydrogenase reductase sdr [Apiospora marii]|uniref:short-chain dehydrogenase reductase sdr n=1 Tax=Apiospora marii TaxID=335849 RepID=UPI00312D77F5
MAGLLKGTAFITGAASGIGRQTALHFAAAGVQRLVLADINADALTGTMASLQERHADIEIMPLELDVRNAAAVKSGLEKAKQRFGRIDIAVNNAGISGSGKPTHEVDEAEWLNVTDVLLNGVWRCQREELAIMTGQEVVSPREGRGCIINMASMYGLVAHNAAGAYTAAKHGKYLKWRDLPVPSSDLPTPKPGVVGLTRTDALRYGPQGIRINAVAPGYTETPLVRAPMQRSAEAEAALMADVRKAPLGRLATAEEIADCIVFLASPMSSFVHGSVLVADGGFTAG